MWKLFIGLTIILSGIVVIASSDVLNYTDVNRLVDYSDRNIADDEIIAAILPPAPPSVTDLKRVLKEEIKAHNSANSKITMLNVSKNNLTFKGASDLIEFILDNQELSDLEEIDLSCNRIKDWRGQEGYDVFVKRFMQLLKRKSLKSINLRINYLGLDWVRYIFAELSTAETTEEEVLILIKKIKLL